MHFSVCTLNLNFKKKKVKSWLPTVYIPGEDTDAKSKTKNTLCLRNAMENEQIKIQNTQVKLNFK